MSDPLRDALEIISSGRHPDGHRGAVNVARAALSAPPPTVEVNVTVNDQNLLIPVFWQEINTMAPWMDKGEQHRWAERLAALVPAQPAPIDDIHASWCALRAGPECNCGVHVHDWLSGEHAFQCACGAWEKEQS